MKKKVVFIERKPTASVSIERVFRQIAMHIGDEFEVEFQQVPYGYGPLAILQNLLFFRPIKGDVYHVTGDVHYITLRMPRAKTILTIHDLVFLHRREGIKHWLLKKLFLDLPVRRSRVVTAISTATRDEIAAEMPDCGEIRVIVDPLVDDFQPSERQFNEEKPRILHIGTAPNKNLENVIKALTGFDCVLRIIGRPSEVAINDLLANGIEFEWDAGLDSDAMTEEYKKADIVLFCSTYEGFGLPIIEAQAMHRPVITSNIAPMNEVAGDGAILVDPHDPASIRAAVERVAEDANLRKMIVEKGIENIKRFAPEPIAAQYAEIYRNIAEDEA